MSGHTPGRLSLMAPTKVGGPLGDAPDCGLVADNGGDPVVIGETWLYGPGNNGKRHTLPSGANAERLKACWNALEGFADPDAAPDLLKAAKRLVADSYTGVGGYERASPQERWDSLRAAIERAEGDGGSE